MSEDVRKLRSIDVSFNFDIGDGYTLDFGVYRDFRDKPHRGEIEVALNEVENNLSYNQMVFMSQIIGNWLPIAIIKEHKWKYLGKSKANIKELFDVSI